MGGRLRQVLLYIQNVLNKFTFSFVQIALLAGGDLKLDVFAIEDYDQRGNEMLWPNIRKPQCPDYTLCQECLPEYEDEVHFVPGDMYILGIVPVHTIGSSPLTRGPIKSGSIDAVETIRFGIKEAQSSFQDRVPNANIGLIVIDSCNDPQVIQEKILSVYRLGVYADGEFVQVKDKILGYIGGWGSDVSVAVAEVASRLGFVQIGYACTATALSNRSLYPYFLRTSAPDRGQAEAMVQIVKYLGYNLVQILHSTCTYGEGGRNMILDAIERNNNTICVAQSVGFSRQINPVDLIESINKQKDAKVILLFVSSFDIGRLLPILNDAFQNKEYLFIASEGWGTRKVINGFINLKGAITLSSELHVNAKFQDHLKELKPDGSDPDPWLRPYMENTFGCYYEWSYNKSSGIQCRYGKHIYPYRSKYILNTLWIVFNRCTRNFSQYKEQMLLLIPLIVLMKTG